MAQQQLTLLDEMRLARASAHQLRLRVETATLTEADGLRMLRRITECFDHLMGTVEAERAAGAGLPPALMRPYGPVAPGFTVIDGGRA